MSIYVACRCGQAFSAPPHLAGKTVSCPACQQPLSVPAAGAAPVPQMPAQFPAYSVPQAPTGYYPGQTYAPGAANPAATGGNANLVPWAVGLGIAAVTIVVVLLVTMTIFGNRKAVETKKAAEIASLHPWVSSDGLFTIGFGAPVDGGAEVTQKTSKGTFSGVAYGARGSYKAPASVSVKEYRFPAGISPAEARDAFLAAVKERHAYMVSKRRYSTVATKDITFAGQPGWELEWETIFHHVDATGKNGMGEAMWGHTRERTIISGERIYVVIVSQEGEHMSGLTYIPDERFFSSMKVLTTPQSPTVVEITKPEAAK